MSPDEEFVYIGFGGAIAYFTIFSTETYELEGISLPSGTGPTAMAISPDGKKLYIANVISKDISVFNVESRNIELNIPLSHPPYDLTTSTDGGFIYASHELSGIVSVIDTTNYTVIKEIEVGDRPTAILTVVLR